MIEELRFLGALWSEVNENLLDKKELMSRLTKRINEIEDEKRHERQRNEERKEDA